MPAVHPPADEPVLLVVGGSGYLGRHVVRHAAARGWRPVAVASSQPGDPLDVRDEAAVLARVGDLRPTAVVNCAYRQSGPEARVVNVDGAGHVAAAAAKVRARLVHLSTDVVFGAGGGRPYTEDDRPEPVTDYGRQKADGERAVVSAAAGALVVRTSLIFGGPSGEPSNHEEAAADPSATFYVDELRSPVQVDDLAAAVVELAGRPDVAGVLHVAGATHVSRHEMATLVTGRPVPGGRAPQHRVKDCRLDSSRARELLATRLRGIDEVWRR